MASKVISVGAEVLTLAQLKNYLVVEHTQHDQFIAYLIRAARSYIEREIDQDVIEKTRIMSFTSYTELYFDVLSNSRFFYIHEAPVKTITSITYEDSEDNLKTINASEYMLHTDTIPARVGFNNGFSITTNNTYNNIKVTFTTGETQPDDLILQMMYLVIGDWYEQKQDSIPINFKGMNLGVDRLKNLVKNLWL